MSELQPQGPLSEGTFDDKMSVRRSAVLVAFTAVVVWAGFFVALRYMTTG
jgi:hypothetical protein